MTRYNLDILMSRRLVDTHVGGAIVIRREEPSKTPLLILGVIVFTILALTVYALISYHGESSASTNPYSSSVPSSLNTSNCYVVIYGSDYCGACKVLKEFFNDNGINYTFREVYTTKKYVKEYFKLIKTVAEALGISEDELAYTPFSVVVNSKGNVTAIVVGAIRDRDFWINLMVIEDPDRILVYYKSEPESITSREYISLIEDIVFERNYTRVTSIQDTDTGEYASTTIVLTLVALAAIDSINPCAISTTILLALTASTMGFMGRKEFIPVAMFIAGVYIGYVLAGYLISSVIALSKIFMILILFLAIGFIVRDFIELRSGRELAIECRERECLPGFLQKLPLWILPVGILVFGVVVSWTFMMCSAAPYIVFLTILSQSIASPYYRLLYILVYCLLIIVPLVIASIAPLAFLKKVSLTLKKIIVVRIAILSIITGMVLYYIVLLI